jgi:hypothetical protein
MSSTFTQLLSSPFRLTTLNDKKPPILHERIYLNNSNVQTKASPTLREPFPIAQLPYELRQLIYSHYFASLPAQDITCSNARLPHHSVIPLALSSPFLEFDPASNLLYRNTTFSFSCPEALKTFSKTLSSGSGNVDKKKEVRKVKVLYGRYDQPTRDWVYLLTSNFPQLEEVTFLVDTEKSGFDVELGCFGNWWGCVRNAVREGLSCIPGIGGRKGMLTLRVEDGEWGVVEVIRV